MKRRGLNKTAGKLPISLIKTGGCMTRIEKGLKPILLAILILLPAAIGFAQDTHNVGGQAQPATLQVPVGQKMDVEGVITSVQPDSLTVRSLGGGSYKIALAGTEIKEKKANPFRGAKAYSKTNLVQGLQIEIEGTGDSSGSIVARKIRVRNDHFILAQTMDARVVPVENDLKNTQVRLGETEQNAQRLSGQVRELTAITDIVRDSAKAAQSSADGAMTEAKTARSSAENAKVGVKAANDRISSLDAYDVKTVTTVNFKAGSAVLSEKDKTELDKLADNTKSEKGFLIEVIGFASSDGDEAFNRRLSQKRAEAVIQYLAENYSISLRRFVMPMGYGEKNPVADNTTVAGRKENRRVEVKVLVNKGLIPSEDLLSSSNVTAN
jgi:outer membrane protein OmpA-like peptidoglycan-associated protein